MEIIKQTLSMYGLLKVAHTKWSVSGKQIRGYLKISKSIQFVGKNKSELRADNLLISIPNYDGN